MLEALDAADQDFRLPFFLFYYQPRGPARQVFDSYCNQAFTDAGLVGVDAYVIHTEMDDLDWAALAGHTLSDYSRGRCA